jgi:mRNA-degrading endonuclease toxin of MazEF toxin-antitoxin module
MPLPLPHPGRVISYAYLWAREHGDNRESGIKNRPCVIVLDRQVRDGVTIVTVVAVTHTPPSDPTDAVEIPAAIKAHLGLDDQRSWIVLTEVNSFVWPGPDLSPISGTSPARFDYGVLPPGFFRKVRDDLIALIKTRRVQIVPRSQ